MDLFFIPWMRNTMIATRISQFPVFLIACLFATAGQAWTIKADFEDGVIGTKAESPTDGFHDTAGHSRIVGSPVLSGHQAASVTATKGKTGFGVWGGGFNFPTPLHEGDEIWYRVNTYYPSGWDFSCGGCTEGMKFMRIHTRSATRQNEGYIHTFIKSDDSNGNNINLGHIKPSTEVNDPYFTFVKPLGPEITRDRWHTFEMYVKFSSNKTTPNGIYRVWMDGDLIYENTHYPTLVSPTSDSNKAYLYTYWNNGAPKTQTSYVDDVIITNEVPGRKDAAGNPYIGVGPSIYIAPPNPPSALNTK